MDLSLIQSLQKPADSKIVLLVMDGVGGLPQTPDGQTELEAAETPNFDALLPGGVCGLQQPVASGITPGSGPGHLGLFGYDPTQYRVGRGVLSALGIDFDLHPNDVAARGNFCTIDADGLVTDRRAGRIPTHKNEELCEVLRTIEMPGVEVFVETVKEHRLLLVLRGEGLSGELDDTDPQEVGAAPLAPSARTAEAKPTADLVQQFLARAREKLAGHDPANMVLLRGFAQQPDWPHFPEVFGLKAAAIAAYPMYRGVAKLVGMDAFHSGDDFDEQLDLLAQHWDDYDFFYVHYKQTDSSGEDGDFDRKKRLIEEVDAHLPRVLDLDPDVLLVTGDHSTPSTMKYHSWHPVPVLLSSEACRPDPVGHAGETFGESACLGGGLGPRMMAHELIPLALAHAGRLDKFGA